jgi:LemA protein
MMKKVLIIMAAIVAVILMGVFLVQGAQNGAINREEQIATAQSDVKIQEKRRADLIPNLVDCVKQYDKHEYETLMGVIEARGANTDATVNEVKTMINAVVEQYPQLQSNSNYKQLMNELSITENLIAEYRSNFNKQVKEYNRYVRKFPTRLFLSMTGYETIEYEYLNYNVSSDAPTNLFGE